MMRISSLRGIVLCLVVSTWGSSMELPELFRLKDASYMVEESSCKGFMNSSSICRCGTPPVLLKLEIHGLSACMYYLSLEETISGGAVGPGTFAEMKDCDSCAVHYRECRKVPEEELINCLFRRLNIQIRHTQNETNWGAITSVKSECKAAFVPRDIEKEKYDNETETTLDESLIYLQKFGEYVITDEFTGNYTTGEVNQSKFYFKVLTESSYCTPDNLTDDFEEIYSRNKRHSRPRDMEDSCKIPRQLLTSSIKCQSLPSKTECIQKCLWGHTVEGGIRQVYTCNKTDNNWEPNAIRECLPFVNCETDLYPEMPGELECIGNTVSKGPTCRIKCFANEMFDEVPEDIYTCDINGKWEKPLPFCAMNGSALKLVTAPEIKVHDYAGFEIENSKK